MTPNVRDDARRVPCSMHRRHGDAKPADQRSAEQGCHLDGRPSLVRMRLTALDQASATSALPAAEATTACSSRGGLAEGVSLVVVDALELPDVGPSPDTVETRTDRSVRAAVSSLITSPLGAAKGTERRVGACWLPSVGTRSALAFCSSTPGHRPLPGRRRQQASTTHP
jgi:hypothetical protein